MSNIGCKVVTDFVRPDPKLVEAFRGMPVANIDDNMGRTAAVHQSIRPLNKVPLVPKMMQQCGYVTGAIGKWHLGMGDGNVNWNETVKPGAKEIGFDYSCLIAATNDRVPTVYVENGDVVGLDPADPIEVSYEHNFEGEPTAISHPEMLKMQWAHGHNNSIVNRCV